MRRRWGRFHIRMHLRTRRVCQKLRAEADPQHRSVDPDHALKRRDFRREVRVFVIAQIRKLHSPQHHQQPKLIQVRGDFIPLPEFSNFHGNAEVPEDGDNPPGRSMGGMLQDDRTTHRPVSVGTGAGSVKRRADLRQPGSERIFRIFPRGPNPFQPES